LREEIHCENIIFICLLMRVTCVPGQLSPDQLRCARMKYRKKLTFGKSVRFAFHAAIANA